MQKLRTFLLAAEFRRLATGTQTPTGYKPVLLAASGTGFQPVAFRKKLQSLQIKAGV
jgi:hypothetical protein